MAGIVTSPVKPGSSFFDYRGDDGQMNTFLFPIYIFIYYNSQIHQELHKICSCKSINNWQTGGQRYSMTLKFMLSGHKWPTRVIKLRGS